MENQEIEVRIEKNPTLIGTRMELENNEGGNTPLSYLQQRERRNLLTLIEDIEDVHGDIDKFSEDFSRTVNDFVYRTAYNMRQPRRYQDRSRYADGHDYTELMLFL